MLATKAGGLWTGKPTVSLGYLQLVAKTLGISNYLVFPSDLGERLDDFVRMVLLSGKVI